MNSNKFFLALLSITCLSSFTQEHCAQAAIAPAKSVLKSLFVDQTQAILSSSYDFFCEELCLRDSLLSLAACYVITIGAIVVHEFGHALCGKVLLHQPMNITITPSFLRPSGAAYFKTAEIKKYHPIRRIAMYAAGPLFGFSSAFVAFNFLRLIKAPSYLKAACIGPMIDTFINLLPWEGSDGSGICSEIGIWYDQWGKPHTEENSPKPDKKE